MRAFASVSLIFAGSALAGPLIRFALWPPSILDRFPFRDFVYDLILLLWPMQPLAVIEASVGTFLAVTIAIGANILAFSIVGLVAGISMKHAAILFMIYLAICLMLLLFALWMVGFSIADLNVTALTVAFTLYALPFWTVFR